MLEKLSAPLHALISNGSMKESKSRTATLDDVDVETFVAFAEFAYTNDYKTPARKDDITGASSPKVAKPNRITKRHRESNTKLQKMKLKWNEKYFGSATLQMDFDDFLFESLWDSFESRTYPKLETFTPTSNFMVHAKLYVFSTKYLAEPLRQRCLAKLHQDLRKLIISAKNTNLILDLLDYVYSNTGRTEPTGNSALRDLVIHYAACLTPILSQHEDFFLILDSHAEMGSDLVMEMLK